MINLGLFNQNVIAQADPSDRLTGRNTGLLSQEQAFTLDSEVNRLRQGGDQVNQQTVNALTQDTDFVRVSTTIGRQASSGRLSREEAVEIYQSIANLI